jgi:hypothetical protein
MAYPRSSNHPDYTGSSKFIPEIWDSRIQVRFYKKTIFMEIANTMYEGDVKKFGDTVRIRTYPDITISNYSKGQKLNIQLPDSTATSLTIDKGKYFNFLVDDVDETQSDLDLVNAFSETAAEQLAVGIDADVLQNTYSSANSSNIGATAGVNSAAFNLGAANAPITLTKANILEYIVDVRSVLKEQNVPDESLWIVLPPHFTNLIPKSDFFEVPCYSNVAA